LISRYREKRRSNSSGQRLIRGDGSIALAARNPARSRIGETRRVWRTGVKFDLHQGVTGKLAPTFQTAGDAA
jgi:hypothetical protein